MPSIPGAIERLIETFRDKVDQFRHNRVFNYRLLTVYHSEVG